MLKSTSRPHPVRLRYSSCSPELQAAIVQVWQLANPFLTASYFHALFLGADPTIVPTGYLDTLDLHESAVVPDGVIYPNEPFCDPSTARPITSLKFVQAKLFDL